MGLPVTFSLCFNRFRPW